jgi:hypothetical protein
MLTTIPAKVPWPSKNFLTVQPTAAGRGRASATPGGTLSGRASLRSLTTAAACARRKPPFWAGERPARPYSRAIQNRFPMENAKGA